VGKIADHAHKLASAYLDHPEQRERVWSDYLKLMADMDAIVKDHEEKRKAARRESARKSAAEEAARRLREEEERRQREAADTRLVYRRCGDRYCHCMKPGGALHGPYRYGKSKRVDGRVVTSYGGKVK
jgi:hypothetical protein